MLAERGRRLLKPQTAAGNGPFGISSCSVNTRPRTVGRPLIYIAKWSIPVINGKFWEEKDDPLRFSRVLSWWLVR
jgi:hypothetical protein